MASFPAEGWRGEVTGSFLAPSGTSRETGRGGVREGLRVPGLTVTPEPRGYPQGEEL